MNLGEIGVVFRASRIAYNGQDIIRIYFNQESNKFLTLILGEAVITAPVNVAEPQPAGGGFGGSPPELAPMAGSEGVMALEVGCLIDWPRTRVGSGDWEPGGSLERIRIAILSWNRRLGRSSSKISKSGSSGPFKGDFSCSIVSHGAHEDG